MTRTKACKLIEYTFPTPLDGPTAIRHATELLVPLGFVVAPPNPIPLPKGHFEIELRRGLKWRKPTDVRRWLHAVKIEWAENQVTVSASLPPSENHISIQSGKLGVWQAEAIQRMLTEFAESIEKLLDGRWQAETALASLEAVDQQIAAEARQRSRLRIVIIIALLALLGAAVAIVVRLRR